MTSGEAPDREKLPDFQGVDSRPYASPIVVKFENKYEALSTANDALPKWSEQKRRSRSMVDEQESGVKSWEEGLRLAMDGWSEGRKRLTDKVVVLQRVAYERRPRRSYSYAGQVPVVPLFLSGDPECMMSIEPQQKVQSRVYKVATSSQISANTKRETVETWGAALLSVINQIENRGDRVEVFWVSISSPCVSQREDPTRGPKVAFSIKLKSATDVINVDDLAFWLMHPAAQRRVQFALKETLDIERYYYNKYGFAISDQDLLRRVVGNNVAIFSVDPRIRDLESAMDSVSKQIERGIQPNCL